MRPLQIIAFAYACEPGKGSEPGAGWAWVRSLAQLGEVWVVTRANNREVIEPALEHVPERDRLRFVYVDLPARARRWKRGQRGVRLYYLLWQLAAVRRLRGLRPSIRADVVWHVTMANGWLGSLAPLVGRPFVYGPIGGGVSTPWRSMSGAPAASLAYEVLRTVAQVLGRFVNPFARLAWARADLILAQNADTVQWLPRRRRAHAVVFPNPVLEPELVGAPGRARAPLGDPPIALFAGRLIAWKGADLAVRAIAQAPDWRLDVYGRGPEEPRLRRLVDELGVGERVTFRGWVSRDELLGRMRNDVAALLFPSLHEEAGWIVAEALGCGLPVVCVDRGGPPAIAGRAGVAVASGARSEMVGNLARALTDGALPASHVAVAEARRFLREEQVARLRTLVDRLELSR